MKKIFLIFVLCSISLWGTPLSSDSNSISNNTNGNIYPKIIYLSYDKIPKKIINGQIFKISIKYIITDPKYQSLKYQFSNINNIKLITPNPIITKDKIYTINTFYLQDINGSNKLPKITATAINHDNNTSYQRTAILTSRPIDIITLNPPDNFSNVIAKQLTITDYKTTTYDNNSNILLFFAQAKQANLANIHIKNIKKQGIESINVSKNSSTIIYYAIINKDIQTFKFTYFNLLTQNYATISIPIVVINDSVSTQTNLSPITKQHKILKLIIATVLLFILLVIIIFRRKYFYLFLAILVSLYIIYLIIPSKEICVKQGSNIKILPIPQGIIFEHTNKIIYLQELNKRDGYIRVKLNNNKVGWIKDEDICSN